MIDIMDHKNNQEQQQVQIWGKLLGVIFGFLFGHIFGALLGLWLGHKFDTAMQGQSGLDELFTDRIGKQDRYFYATFSVMGHIAKAKGIVTDQEILVANNFMDKMGLHGAAREKAQAAFKEGKLAGFALKQTIREFRELSRGRRDLLQLFLEIQLQAAFADFELHANERKILHVIARELGFSAHELERLLTVLEAEQRFHKQQHQRRPAKDELKDAYEILGLTENASLLEVKKNYRKLMNQHHPDKLVAKGLPPEMMDLAKSKAQDIQRAYELIKKSRD